MRKGGVNTFEKGLNTDASIASQPNGTYRDSLNVTLLNDRGEYFALCNEKGTSNLVNIPDGYSVMGHTIVDDVIVLCLANPTDNYSQIGVIQNGTYTQKVPASGEDNELGFTIENPVDIVGRKVFTGDILVYFTDNNEPIGILNLDDLPTSIAKTKKIIPDINLPTVTITDILSGGRLNGGVVQFMVRYLNKELVPTVTSIPTNPVPILGSEPGATKITAESDVFGADYNDNVNKSVKLNITGLDTDYPFFELIAIEYEGPTSAAKALLAGTYDITSSSRTLIYEGQTDDAIELTVDEVIADPITYDTAKCVEQKDGRVFFSNLTNSRSRYKDELQEIANNITVSYAIGTVDDAYYADPLNCVSNKTYKRGEVYSLGIGVIFKDGSTSFVYHIPAPIKFTGGNPGRYLTNNPNELGLFISQEKYPANQGYPDDQGDGNTNIRHHMMPDIWKEPTFTNTTSCKIIRLVFDNINLSEELKNDIQEIVFFREPRTTSEKRSCLAQGFVNNIRMGASEYESYYEKAEVVNSGNRVGDVINNSYHFRKDFGFYNCQINTFYDMDDWGNGGDRESYSQHQGSKLSGHHGYYYSCRTLDKTLYGSVTSEKNSGDGDGWTDTDRDAYQNFVVNNNTDKFCFNSPETLLADGIFINPSTIEGAKLRKILDVTSDGTSFYQDNGSNKYDADFDTINSKTFILKNASFNQIYNTKSVTSYGNSPIARTIKHAQYINNGIRTKLPGLPSYEFDNDWSGKTLYLQLTQNHQQNADAVGNLLDPAWPKKTLAGGWANIHPGRGFYDGASYILNIDSWDYSLDMYDLYNPISNQYGRIESSQYVPLYRTKNLNITTTGSVAGGDIFITRYTHFNKNLFSRFYPFQKDTTGNLEYFREYFDNDVDTKLYTQSRIFRNLYSPQAIPGDVYGACVVYFVESLINTYFRHIGEDGIPYHPATGTFEVFSAIPNQEDNRNYNVQYSIDNTLKDIYVTRPIFDESIVRFPNRTIYSERTTEDSKVDEYQIFKQNSIYDLPEDTGEIIDTFVWNNELFSHTPKALWRNFVNTTTQQATTIGEVVYGTGDLFSLPSKKVITSDGGYAGTISQFGNVITPQGYFFVDLLQRKVFKLTDGLEAISQLGMQQFFDENLRVQKTGGVFDDNTFHPTLPKGIAMAWDNEYNRLMLTQKGATEFTISYSPVYKAWISFHSYLPNTYIEYDKFLYSIINNNNTPSLIHIHNIGEYGVFHNNPPEETNIRIVSTTEPNFQKTFDNFEVYSRSYDNGNYVEEDTFTHMRCRTLYLDSGELDILTTNAWDPAVANNEVLSRWKKSHYQIAIPRDNQEANLDNVDGWEDATRLKGKYLDTTFRYNNLNNREFIVNFIQYLYRIVAR
jgi:hypothetical protein